ncbi:MAG: hypothetical protein A4E19_19935 [Nitrospira sp. SG-bin1]|nr:MAG: hypothetical protein A4E19_19935 [Nitrospira sp. SG-bin1]
MAVVASTLVFLILSAALYIWSGGYNVAASDPHLEFVSLSLATIRDRSIEVRAGETEAPRLEPETAMKGFRPYHGLCSICHSAPGLEAGPIRQGLNPKPPLLTSERIQRRSNEQLFWIVKHGIKMSGMPAFGPTHNDRELWQIVSFVRQLPRITDDEYLAMVRAAGRFETDDHGHDHGRHTHHQQ